MSKSYKMKCFFLCGGSIDPSSSPSIALFLALKPPRLNQLKKFVDISNYYDKIKPYVSEEQYEIFTKDIAKIEQEYDSHIKDFLKLQSTIENSKIRSYEDRDDLVELISITLINTEFMKIVNTSLEKYNIIIKNNGLNL